MYQSCMHTFIHSFNDIQSVIQLIYLINQSSTYPITYSMINQSINQSNKHVFIDLHSKSVNQSFIHASIHPLIHSFNDIQSYLIIYVFNLSIIHCWNWFIDFECNWLNKWMIQSFLHSKSFEISQSFIYSINRTNNHAFNQQSFDHSINQ